MYIWDINNPCNEYSVIVKYYIILYIDDLEFRSLELTMQLDLTDCDKEYSDYNQFCNHIQPLVEDIVSCEYDLKNYNYKIEIISYEKSL